MEHLPSVFFCVFLCLFVANPFRFPFRGACPPSGAVRRAPASNSSLPFFGPPKQFPGSEQFRAIPSSRPFFPTVGRCCVAAPAHRKPGEGGQRRAKADGRPFRRRQDLPSPTERREMAGKAGKRRADRSAPIGAWNLPARHSFRRKRRRGLSLVIWHLALVIIILALVTSHTSRITFLPPPSTACPP
jgi:hypothetical protein